MEEWFSPITDLSSLLSINYCGYAIAKTCLTRHVAKERHKIMPFLKAIVLSKHKQIQSKDMYLLSSPLNIMGY